MARVRTASEEVSAIMVETRAAATGRAGQDAERWWKRAVKERRCPTCLKETRVVLEWAPVEQASLCLERLRRRWCGWVLRSASWAGDRAPAACTASAPALWPSALTLEGLCSSTGLFPPPLHPILGCIHVFVLRLSALVPGSCTQRLSLTARVVAKRSQAQPDRRLTGLVVPTTAAHT